MQRPKLPAANTRAKAADTSTPTPTSMPRALAQRELAMNSIKEAYQKNFAALTEATQTLTTGAASVFQRQQDLLRNAMIKASAAAHERIASVAPRQCPEAIDRYKQALDTGLTNARQIAELAEQSKRDAFDSIHKQMNERFQERIEVSNRFFEKGSNTAGDAPSPKKKSKK
jgi:hypothetical protein